MVKWILLAVSLAGCQELDAPLVAPALDEAYFRCEVEPVLAARCSFYACHGSAQRPLRIYAVNRLRLNPGRMPDGYVLASPLTAEERRANFESALSFASPRGLDASLLLLKPLDVDAGGWFHEGETIYGAGDVFATPSDPGYAKIAAWLGGQTSPPTCTPTDEVGP